MSDTLSAQQKQAFMIPAKYANLPKGVEHADLVYYWASPPWSDGKGDPKKDCRDVLVVEEADLDREVTCDEPLRHQAYKFWIPNPYYQDPQQNRLQEQQNEFFLYGALTEACQQLDAVKTARQKEIEKLKNAPFADDTIPDYNKRGLDQVLEQEWYMPHLGEERPAKVAKTTHDTAASCDGGNAPLLPHGPTPLNGSRPQTPAITVSQADTPMQSQHASSNQYSSNGHGSAQPPSRPQSVSAWQLNPPLSRPSTALEDQFLQAPRLQTPVNQPVRPPSRPQSVVSAHPDVTRAASIQPGSVPGTPISRPSSVNSTSSLFHDRDENLLQELTRGATPIGQQPNMPAHQQHQAPQQGLSAATLPPQLALPKQSAAHNVQQQTAQRQAPPPSLALPSKPDLAKKPAPQMQQQQQAHAPAQSQSLQTPVQSSVDLASQRRLAEQLQAASKRGNESARQFYHSLQGEDQRFVAALIQARAAQSNQQQTQQQSQYALPGQAPPVAQQNYRPPPQKSAASYGKSRPNMPQQQGVPAAYPAGAPQFGQQQRQNMGTPQAYNPGQGYAQQYQQQAQAQVQAQAQAQAQGGSRMNQARDELAKIQQERGNVYQGHPDSMAPHQQRLMQHQIAQQQSDNAAMMKQMQRTQHPNSQQPNLQQSSFQQPGVQQGAPTQAHQSNMPYGYYNQQQIRPAVSTPNGHALQPQQSQSRSSSAQLAQHNPLSGSPSDLEKMSVEELEAMWKKEELINKIRASQQSRSPGSTSNAQAHDSPAPAVDAAMTSAQMGMGSRPASHPRAASSSNPQIQAAINRPHTPLNQSAQSQKVRTPGNSGGRARAPSGQVQTPKSDHSSAHRRQPSNGSGTDTTTPQYNVSAMKRQLQWCANSQNLSPHYRAEIQSMLSELDHPDVSPAAVKRCQNLLGHSAQMSALSAQNRHRSTSQSNSPSDLERRMSGQSAQGMTTSVSQSGSALEQRFLGPASQDQSHSGSPSRGQPVVDLTAENSIDPSLLTQKKQHPSYVQMPASQYTGHVKKPSSDSFFDPGEGQAGYRSDGTSSQASQNSQYLSSAMNGSRMGTANSAAPQKQTVGFTPGQSNRRPSTTPRSSDFVKGDMANTDPIPEKIMQLAKGIQRAEKNKDGMPVRGRLADHVSTAEFTSGGYLKAKAELRHWMGDNRLLTDKWWQYITSWNNGYAERYKGQQ